MLYYIINRKIALLLVTAVLAGCTDSNSSSPAPELEGILVTSSAPVVMSNLHDQNVYLYLIPPDCESCWQTLASAESQREQFNIVGVVASEDNFAVYEKARSHFITLLPIYADHDGNIAYDYDAEPLPLWITVENGMIHERSPELPEALTSLRSDKP